MRETATLLLDVVGLLLVAAGAAALLFLWLGWGCLIVAGLIVLAGSMLAQWQARPAGSGD